MTKKKKTEPEKPQRVVKLNLDLPPEAFDTRRQLQKGDFVRISDYEDYGRRGLIMKIEGREAEVMVAPAPYPYMVNDKPKLKTIPVKYLDYDEETSIRVQESFAANPMLVVHGTPEQDPEGWAKLKAAFNREAIEAAFGPGGGGIAEVLKKLAEAGNGQKEEVETSKTQEKGLEIERTDSD